MIKLAGLVTLKPITEAESFTAKSKDTGKVSVFKSKDARDAAIKAGTHEKRKDDKDGGVKDPTKKDTPKVNIFKKDKEEPKKDDGDDISQPNSVEGTGQADPKVNKQVRKIADKMGISSKKLGKEEYEKKMAQAAVEALTDSNFHTEARWLVADLEGKPELRERPNYPKFDDPDYEKKMDAVREKYASQYADDVDDDARNLGIKASQAAGWGGATAMEAIVFDLKMSGSHKLANKILKSFKDAQQKQEGRISIGDMMEDVINEGPSTEEKRIAMLAVRKQAKYRQVSLEQAIQDQINALEELKRDAKRGKLK